MEFSIITQTLKLQRKSPTLSFVLGDFLQGVLDDATSHSGLWVAASSQGCSPKISPCAIRLAEFPPTPPWKGCNFCGWHRASAWAWPYC